MATGRSFIHVGRELRPRTDIKFYDDNDSNNNYFIYSPTFGLSTLLGHDTYDHGIADDDGNKWKEVDGEDVEEIIGKLMSSRWKEVERDA